MTSQIRWKKGDYIRLGRAVSAFNKKIEKLDNLSYLPNKVTYKEIKESILSRNELNRTINSLRRFQKAGAEDLYVTEAGQMLTKWERQELGSLKASATRRLQSSINELNEPLESGFSRAQMGSVELNRLKSTLENIGKLENVKGYEFKLVKERLLSIGSSDYDLKKAIIYKENYLEELKKYSNFENYDLLIKKIKNMTPQRFYEFMSQTELTKDLTWISDENFSQQEFNYFLEDLGFDLDSYSDSVDKDLFHFAHETHQKTIHSV